MGEERRGEKLEEGSQTNNAGHLPGGPGSDSFSHKTKSPVLPAAAKHDLVSNPLRNRTFGT